MANDTTEFIIHFAGDPPVGIFPATWTISGPFYFDDTGELELFRDKLKEAWEYCSDTPVTIKTKEEIGEEELVTIKL